MQKSSIYIFDKHIDTMKKLREKELPIETAKRTPKGALLWERNF